MNKIKNNNDNNFYGNIAFYHPDGTFMFYHNERRANWYLERNLVKILEIDDNGYIHLQFTFTPNGKGFANSNDDFHLSLKENICVVSGISDPEKLNKHHIVPYMFRKHFPEHIKTNNHHDIVLIDRNLHFQYENYAELLKDEIAMELGLPSLRQFQKINEGNRRVVNALKYKSEQIPQARKEHLEGFFMIYNNLNPTPENLDYVEDNILPYYRVSDYGRLVVNKITDFQKFCQRWRQHFIDIMQPQFMPKGWDVEKPVYFND